MKNKFDRHQILRLFLGSLLRLQNVERGSIWVRQGERYRCIEAMGHESEKITGISISNDRPSIVGWVIENGRMTIGRAGQDDRHFEDVEKELCVKSNIILCFPLIFDTGEVYGALELIDTTDMGSRINLDKEYLKLLENITAIGSIALSKYAAYTKQVEENRELKKIIHSMRGSGPIIGQSRPVLEAMERVSVYAKVDYPVLITGESGTGKDLFARELHRMSNRRDLPFLAQNCSAIPATLLESELFGHRKGAFTGAVSDKVGLFEAADKGTVFLDEIGDMSYELQARILRVLQDGEIKPLGSTIQRRTDVRIISATHIDLPAAIEQKRFREDLYYRLNVLPLHILPLRERKEDIQLLLKSFIALEAKKLEKTPKRISPEALSYLTRYPWKGNIRELKNVIRHIMVISPNEVITPDALPIYMLEEVDPDHGGRDFSETWNRQGPCEVRAGKYEGYTWKQLEKEYVLYLLDKHRWNISRAAIEADQNRSTFDSKMRRLGIRKNQTKTGDWGNRG